METPVATISPLTDKPSTKKSVLRTTVNPWLMPSLVVGLLATVVLSVGIGAVRITPYEIWQILGKSVGYATDVDDSKLAILMAIRLPRVCLAVLVGAGLAISGAAIQGLFESGRKDIRVFNRTAERAQQIARHFGTGVSAQPWRTRNEKIADAALIVNTTTLGMNGVGDPEIAFNSAKADAIVADLVYVPLETPLLKSARTHGLVGVDGLGMLLHQAVPGFEKWFGVRHEVSTELYDHVAETIRGS